MRKTIKRKLKGRGGFSILEAFLAMLIMLLVSSIVASGVPIAADVYKKAVETANAQLLVSTTLTVLRDELGTATILTAEHDEGDDPTEDEYIEYMVEGGRLRIIADEQGIKKQLGSDSVLLVSNAAASKNLHTTFESVSFSNGVVTFQNIEAQNEDGTTLASIEEFKIRVLTYNS